jgi:hypothetical protein
MPLLLPVLLWLLHITNRLVRKPGIADLTSCHHFWLFRDLESQLCGTVRIGSELLIL